MDVIQLNVYNEGLIKYSTQSVVGVLKKKKKKIYQGQFWSLIMQQNNINSKLLLINFFSIQYIYTQKVDEY